MTDYGSGALADYTTMSRSLSTDDTFVRAPVWMFGDSIALGTQKDLAVQLLDQRGRTLAVDDWASRPTIPAVDALEERLGRCAPPEQIIMATGTNDIFDPTVMAAQIDRVMALVGCRSEVYWKDVQASRWSQPAAVQVADQRNSGWVNAQIHDAIPLYPNLHLIPWFNALASKPSRITYYLRDGVHPNDTTGVAFHNAIVLQAI